MLWTGPGPPSGRPLAVFIDQPGGPLDQIAADEDVTTFLNDRFEPWFLIPEIAPSLGPAPRMWFFDAQGCVLASSTGVPDATAWINLANRVISAPPAVARAGLRPPPTFVGLQLAADHPLQSMCIPVPSP